MSLISRLSTLYRGFQIFFEPEALPDSRYRARPSVVDLRGGQACECLIDVPPHLFDSAPAAGQYALCEAMRWIEARDGEPTDRASFFAVPWIAPEDFAELEAMAGEHGEPKDGSHDAWLRTTLTIEREAREDGLVPIRIPVPGKPFALWCLQLGIVPDRAARRRYAEAMLERRPV